MGGLRVGVATGGVALAGTVVAVAGAVVGAVVAVARGAAVVGGAAVAWTTGAAVVGTGCGVGVGALVVQAARRAALQSVITVRIHLITTISNL
jgi:hypothetical protein